MPRPARGLPAVLGHTGDSGGLPTERGKLHRDIRLCVRKVEVQHGNICQGPAILGREPRQSKPTVPAALDAQPWCTPARSLAGLLLKKLGRGSAGSLLDGCILFWGRLHMGRRCVFTACRVGAVRGKRGGAVSFTGGRKKSQCKEGRDGKPFHSWAEIDRSGRR